MNKTAIVIGATGLIGKELVLHLDDAKNITKVRTLTRRPTDEISNKVQNHVVDFDQLIDSAGLFEGDLLFSCLGTTAKQAGSKEAQRRIDVDYQYTAAKLASERGVADYLLVSSSGANAASRNPYLKMKGELEDQVTALPFRSLSIFQPSLLLGQRDSERFAEGLAGKVMPLICKLPGLTRYRPIEGAEVARRMVEVSARPNTGVSRYVLEDVFPTDV